MGVAAPRRGQIEGGQQAFPRSRIGVVAVVAMEFVSNLTVSVPDLDQGLAFYRNQLGHELLWRNDSVGQAGLWLPESVTELVLSTCHQYAPNWLVTSVKDAVAQIIAAGGSMVAEPSLIPVGWVAVVAHPFNNPLVLLDLSSGTSTTDAVGQVIGVDSPPDLPKREPLAGRAGGLRPAMG